MITSSKLVINLKVHAYQPLALILFFLFLTAPSGQPDLALLMLCDQRQQTRDTVTRMEGAGDYQRHLDRKLDLAKGVRRRHMGALLKASGGLLKLCGFYDPGSRQGGRGPAGYPQL